MKDRIKHIVIAVLAAVMLLSFSGVSQAKDAICDPSFINPFSEMEWDCTFPIRMGGITLFGESDPATPGKVGSPLCVCREGSLSRIGITVGFREPARIIDVSKGAFCMSAIGVDMGNDNIWGGGGAYSNAPRGRQFAHSHLYVYLPLFLLQIGLDFGCTEKLPLDISYLSEFDPMHSDEELGLVVFPETLLFASPPLILSCIADAMGATFNAPLDALHWCAGSWGTVYPLGGYNAANDDAWVQSSALIATKFLARAHRLLISWGTTGSAALCGTYPMPVLRKTQYKFQWLRPTVSRQCIPLGMSGLRWSSFLNSYEPGKEGNNSIGIWRWRDCCAF